ncbi:FHA domain-containing protein [Urbifossiella limnaea]|uniref:FHA domain protein n=1 Tax=Urbifossiella limnaea TaxID=2528023 RepID=A0A517XMF3_9BACT|nr:FHA domain-containing protein [Urbifossiella limnaea]QDU18689.1 FHA domain protein [Urbifossiella limnaea]
MNDPLIARFAEACGATGPLDLRVGLPDGRVLAEGSMPQPFTLIGRDDACDVTLTDPDVHPRHAWIQVLDGRAYALDLGSRAGVVWPDGTRGPGWMEPGVPLKVGPFRVTLRNPVSARPGRFEVPPTQGDPNLTATRPGVQLEFRSGRPPKDRWAINRVLTLVGKSEACKLNLLADDVAPYHCGLVLTPTGLWVVDLSGQGVVVNGERMRVAPLPDGASLSVGRFHIGCRYPVPTDTPSGLRLRTGRAAPSRTTKPVPPPPDDEVPLGGMPTLDSATGLPSSHILHGAFRRPNSSGAMSAPILLAAGPASDAAPAGKSGRIGSSIPAPPEALADHPAAALIGQLAEIHGQMFEQLQQALLMMARLCGQIRAGRAAAAEQELIRIKELNAELARLQGEVTRLALAEAGSKEMRALDETAVGTAGSEAIHDWVQEKIGKLHRERRERWDTLVGLFAGGGE